MDSITVILIVGMAVTLAFLLCIWIIIDCFIIGKLLKDILPFVNVGYKSGKNGSL